MFLSLVNLAFCPAACMQRSAELVAELCGDMDASGQFLELVFGEHRSAGASRLHSGNFD